MKLTAVNGAIVGNHAKDVIAFYEKNFGFHVIHSGKAFSTENPLDEVYVMEDGEGRRLDVVNMDSIKSEVYAIRINVDDFEEGLALYKEEGFSVVAGPSTSRFAKRALISKDGGAPILLMQHIK